MTKIYTAILGGALSLLPVAAWAAEPGVDAPQPRSVDGAAAFSLLYRADILANVSGGLKQRTTALGNLDVKLDLDLDALLGWRGTSAGLHGIASHGGKPNANHVGSSQGVDNIEVDPNAAKLFQAWIQKQWMDDRLSVLLGLYDLNSEFYVSNSSGIFLHPAAGIGSELAQTGQNGPSVFPTSSMSLRVAYRPTPEVYLQAAVLDGVPGDPDDPRGTHIQFNDGDGTLRVAELGYVPKEGTGLSETDKYAVGAWSYSSRFADLVDVDAAGDPVLRKGNSGLYVLAEKRLYQDARNPDGGVDGFVRYGRAKADFNQFTRYFQTGLLFSGMVPGRNEDQFGVSFITARTGDKYRLAALNAGQQAMRHESAWEVTYRAQLTSWLAVQPNIQYVINPDANAQIKDATVLGVRFEMSAEK